MINGTLTRNCPLHHDRITRLQAQPMRPESDPGMAPKAEPKQDDGQWQVHAQGSATKFSPFQDHSILPKGRTLKAET